MSAEQQDFEKLGRLLKLKQHERPHPRYFNDFSSQVIQRIQAGNAGQSRLSWIERIWENFNARPAYTGLATIAACGLLVAGVIYAERSDGPGLVADTQSPLAGPALAAGGGSLSPTVTLFANSTNPFAPGQIAPGNSLFDKLPLGAQLNVERVSWPVPNK